MSPLGVLIGHGTDRERGTGCTVVLCPQGATPGVMVRGGAPCTRETDIFRPGAGVDPRQAHGVLLTGGSVFGLAATDGVVRFLSERGHGLETPHACIPSVAWVGIYDLGLLDPTAHADAALGYAACVAATADAMEEGTVGVGTGATVGKAAGPERCTKGGVGFAMERLPDGALVAAVVAVNSFGEIVDPDSGRIVAGIRHLDRPGFEPASAVLGTGAGDPMSSVNTTVGIIITNAPLTKEEATELAAVAHNGVAQAVRPSHTRLDGDTLFVLATGGAGSGLPMGRMVVLGHAAARAVARAIGRGVTLATGLGGVPAARELAG